VYNAGHVHSYENTWPLCDFLTGALCRDSKGTELKTFDEPRGTVHITEGNGGVPGVLATFGVQPCNKTTTPGTHATNWTGCRVFGYGGAYGRIIATPTTLTYNRIANNGGVLTDTWTMTQHNHGPFPPNPSTPTPPPTPPTPEPTLYACSKNYTCSVSPSGRFKTPGGCKKRCKPPTPKPTPPPPAPPRAHTDVQN
jgi:hypothetical protein